VKSRRVCQAITKKGVQCTAGVCIEYSSTLCVHHFRNINFHSRANNRPVSERLSELDGPSHVNVARELRDQGCQIVACASGWPDLLIKRNGKLAAVEVKKDDQLSQNQRQVIAELKAVIPTFVCRIKGFKQDGECSFDELLAHLEIATAHSEYHGA
jgi:hypothetical protein